MAHLTQTKPMSESEESVSEISPVKFTRVYYLVYFNSPFTATTVIMQHPYRRFRGDPQQKRPATRTK